MASAQLGAAAVMRDAREPAPWQSVAAALAIMLSVFAVGWPGVGGDWGRDDFMQLAIARLVGSPWALFLHDHYPVPGAVFRPLGFASMWLDTALFGSDYRAHAILDLALHAGVALMLFALLRRFALSPALALLGALAFALHPAALGPALWWSARFDVLAALFVLLALWAASADPTRRWRVPLTLIATLAAAASKEIGLLLVLPLSLLWWPPAGATASARQRALLEIAAVWLCAFGFLFWRGLVLGTSASAILGAQPLGTVLLAGVGRWAHFAPGYLSFLPRLGGGGAALLLAVSTFAALAVAAWRGAACAPRTSRQSLLVACGLCLLLLPALLQAPVAALNAAALGAEDSAVESAMQSRLYYLGLVGLAIVFVAVLAALQARLSVRWRNAVLLPLLFALLAWAPAAHRAADDFAARTRSNAELAHAAVAAVAEVELPSSGCRILFRGVEPPPEWGIFVSMDSIVKALAPDLSRLGHCIIDANYPTWFGLFAAPWTAAEAAPRETLKQDGKEVPWLRVGRLVIAYLEAPTDAADGAGILIWRGRKFVVGEESRGLRSR